MPHSSRSLLSVSCAVCDWGAALGYVQRVLSGVARIPAADGFGEQYDDSDELLVILGAKPISRL
jgi:hypothetical protein